MKISDIKAGDKVTNFYGENLTVLEVIDHLMIRTYEDFNNLYHFTKLTVSGKLLTC